VTWYNLLYSWNCKWGGLIIASCPRVLVALDHPVAVESPCWTIFQQALSALLHLLCLCAWVEPWVASVPLSTCRAISCCLTFKPVLATCYGPSSFVGGGHPRWPLEVTGNISLFKLVHIGTLCLSLAPIVMHCVQVETLCCPSLEWSGHSLLNSSWWHRVWMHQYPVLWILDLLLSLLLLQRHVSLLLHDCTQFFRLEQLPNWLSIIALLKNCYCMYSSIPFYWYCVCWTARSDGNCQLIHPVHKVSFLSIFLVLDWICSVFLWCDTSPKLGLEGQAMSSNHSSLIKHFTCLWKLQ
jgi:hypothetical protein